MKAWRGEILLFVLWGFKTIAWLPVLGNSYRSLLIHFIKRSKLFDRAFYLERYADIGHSVMSPLRHYVTIGDRERRSPMAFFDPDYYRFRAARACKIREHPSPLYPMSGVIGGFLPVHGLMSIFTLIATKMCSCRF